MNPLDRLCYRIGALPIGNLIEDTVRAAVIVLALAFALAGCAGTKDAPIAPSAAIEQPMNRHDSIAARALALQEIGKAAKDGETQRLAIFALANLYSGGGAENAQPAAQVAPQAIGFGAVALGVLDRAFSAVERVAAPVLAYRGQVRGNQTTETVAAINRDVSMNQSNNFLGLGVAGINGAANAGIAGVNALATVAGRPQTPGTSITITGNSGPVNTGSGTLTNASNNPVNPSPVVCLPGTNGPNCSRGP